LPAEQIWPPLHTRPHWPQLLASVWVLTQAPLHAFWPVGQAHPPLTQLAPLGQTRPHWPQFFGSLVTLRQVPLQLL
jgi:hypothetical protein